MKLNLWIIANRLFDLDPEVNIPNSAPVNLKSARGVYANNCVYVYQDGKDVFCSAGEAGGYIRFKDSKKESILEVVQDTFDFFDDWTEQLMNCISDGEIQNAIDISWHVFHNPIILIDEENKLIARSMQYKSDAINDDWKYLCETGYSSVQVIDYLIQQGKSRSYYTNTQAVIYRFPPNPYVNDEISVLLNNEDGILGRLNILQLDRKFNPGDLYLANYIVFFIKQILEKRHRNSIHSHILYPVLGNLLNGQKPKESEENIIRQVMQWDGKTDLQVISFKFLHQEPAVEEMMQVCNLLHNINPQCIATESGSLILLLGTSSSLRHFLFENSDDPEVQFSPIPVSKKIEEVMRKFHLTGAISLPFHRLEYLKYYYLQSSFTLRKIDSTPNMVLWSFYRYAVDSILLSNDMIQIFCAIHPDILSLWERKEWDGGNGLASLNAYLLCDRSLIGAARFLHVHRNTLVYRLNKVLDQLHCDLKDPYTREYLRISYRIIQLNSSLLFDTDSTKKNSKQ